MADEEDGGWTEGYGSSFGGKADQANYDRVLAETGSREAALLAGDDNTGNPDLGTVQGTGYKYGFALPDSVLKAKFGNDRAAMRRARVQAVINGVTVTAPVIDKGPGSGPQEKGVVIDISDALARSLGTGGMAKVKYKLLPDAGADIEANPDQWNKEQEGIRAALPNKIPPVPTDAIYKRPSPPPPGAVAKGSLKAPAPTVEGVAPTPEEKPEVVKPVGAVKAAPLSQDEIDAQKAEAASDPAITDITDPEKQAEAAYQAGQKKVAGAHSAALAPEDNRVAQRINPDTGSLRTVGANFVDQDPYHQELLRGLGPEDRAKLPFLSAAINAGAPYPYMYQSAAQEGSPEEWQGEAPTQESRQYEQQLSPAKARLLGTGPTVNQQVSMIPMQLAMAGGSKDTPPNVMLEGFAHQSVLNNGAHLLNGTKAAGMKTPYADINDPELHKDLMGYNQNQAHGFRGDGSMMLDENGQPHPLYQKNQASPKPYVPRLLKRPQAEFINAMMNVRPSERAKSPAERPGFGERAKWQRRVNEGYQGFTAGSNKLLEELDRKLPEVAMRRVRTNKKTGEKETYVSGHKPWTKGTLESTWRQYHIPLMSQLGMPPIGSKSIRETGQPSHVLIQHAPIFKQTAAEFSPHRPMPAPLSQNPEIGGPAGGANPPGEPGLLSGPGAQAEAEQEPIAAPGSEGAGIEFASPSIREGMKLRGASQALKKEEHQKYRDFSNRLEAQAARQYGTTPADTRDVYGAWKDGAENSLRNIYPDQPDEGRKVISAIKGLHSAQKQVANYKYHDDGPHSIYHLAFNSDNPEEVDRLLEEHGIKNRTLEPRGKKQELWAHIIDTDGKEEPKIGKLIKAGHINDAYQRHGTADFIGDQNGDSREEGARAYREILQRARDQAAQGGPGRGGAPGEPAWWEPYAQEAEENFDRLAKSDPYQEQAKEADKKLAAIDRNKIPQSLKEERKDFLQKSQKFQGEQADQLPDLTAHHFVYKKEQYPEGVKTNEDKGEFFNARNERLDYAKPEHRSIAANVLTHDIIHALANGSTALGWYDNVVTKAMNKFAELAPELKTSKRASQAFKLAMAITSQGQNVYANSESAWHVYQYWKKHGEFPTDAAHFGKGYIGGGTKAGAMRTNFEKLNQWIDDQGINKTTDMLHKEFRVGDMEELFGKKVSGEAADEKLPGSAMLGPKVGVFFQNLFGKFHHTTMDLWFSRTMNRIAGNMMGFSPTALLKDKGTQEKGKAHLTKLGELLDSGAFEHATPEEQAAMRQEVQALREAGGPDAKGLDRRQALALAPTINAWADRAHGVYAKSMGLPKSYDESLKTPERLLAKNIDNNFHGLSDAPRTGEERKQWRAVMKEVDSNLKGHGISITNADKQALLWYLEQHLFQGEGAASSADYLDAAYTLARKVRSGELKAPE